MSSELEKARTRADEAQLKTALHAQIRHSELQNIAMENLVTRIGVAGACIENIKKAVKKAEGSDGTIEDLLLDLKKALKKVDSKTGRAKPNKKRGDTNV